MSGSGDLQALFANLKPRSVSSTAPKGQSSQHSSQPSFEQNTFFQPKASQTFTSPPVTDPSNLPPSNMASAFQSGGASGGGDRTQNLLNLLKFSQPPAAGRVPQQSTPLARSTSESHTMRQETAHGKPVTASDLMSSFLSPQNTPGIRGGGNAPSNPPFSSESIASPTAGSTAQESSQDALLKLLRRSASSSMQEKTTEAPQSQSVPFSFDGTPKSSFTAPKTQSPASNNTHTETSDRTVSPIRMFGSTGGKETTPFEAPPTTAAKENKPIFTYTNPFEALQASRNVTPKPNTSRGGSPAVSNVFNDNHTNGDKRKSFEATPEQLAVRRKLTPKGPSRSSASVERALEKENIGDKLDTIVDQVTEKAEEVLESVEIKQEEEDIGTEIDKMAEKLERTAIDTAVDIKKELDKEENKDVLEKEMPKPVAEAVKNVLDEAAAEAAPGDGWETSDEGPEQAPRDVPVYNFPLKPFISITIMDLPPSKVGVREDGVMEISRFKKEFDQLDRTLASATSKYITYAFVKNGGMRVIRQDDGSDRQVFKNSGDRVFHVTLCTTASSAPQTDEQAVLGVGLSGAVYYATISKGGHDLFESDALDTESLIFPPYPPGDENSSGGMLKTRVRPSSRHPEFFAIGRGKSIHLIWPATALSTKYGVDGSDRTVDVEKLYKDRPLKITTGKAGKDFVFSEDDTLIASLDKTGKLRFWDIRKLVNEPNATASKVQAEDINVPVLSLATASPAEKSWPTSVLFVDKVRPYTKGIALRYMLVGLKQNHTLQLWDIALEKAVQELNFPHDTETDGICSVAYHPNSGIIVVGHPTRNSIFFLHLSAPRYTLPPMSQSSFLERIAIRDPDLPKPEATACISGMREISFASKGHLRSLDLLPIHKTADTPKEGAEAQTLFELYVVHSRGVTCLAIKKEDLGWDLDSKVLHPVENAVETGLIKLGELKRTSPMDETADVNGAADTPQPSKVAKKKASKGIAEPEVAGVKEKLEEFPPAPTTAGDKVVPNGVKGGEGITSAAATPSEKDKKKKKKTGTSSTLAPSSGKALDISRSPTRPLSPSKTPGSATDLNNQASTPPAFANSMASGQPTRSPWTPATSQGAKDMGTTDLPSATLEKEMKKLEGTVFAEFSKQLDKLYRRLDDDKRVQDAANGSRQEAVLRLVSQTLTTNVESSLNRIIVQHIQQVVVPTVTNVTAQAVQSQVGEALARILHTLIPHEIGTQLPVAISSAMQNPTHLRSLTENISKRLAPAMEAHYAELIRTTIGPTFQRLAASAAEKATSEVETRIVAKLRHYEADRQKDTAKLDKLQGTMQHILEMMAHLTEGQIAFQEKILNDRQSITTHLAETVSRPSSSAATAFRSTPQPARQVSSAQPSPIAPPTKRKSDAELELEEIGTMMNEGRYEEASIRWLQSKHQVALFDNLFVNYPSDYLRSAVSPLVAFSVGITVANSFQQNIAARLEWIYTALSTVDTRVSAKSFAFSECI
jgi:hypothetical protein